MKCYKLRFHFIATFFFREKKVHGDSSRRFPGKTHRPLNSERRTYFYTFIFLKKKNNNTFWFGNPGLLCMSKKWKYCISSLGSCGSFGSGSNVSLQINWIKMLPMNALGPAFVKHPVQLHSFLAETPFSIGQNYIYAKLIWFICKREENRP